MGKGRLEAFSDAVIAIAITVMVLELKVPHGADWESLRSVIPALLTYLLSFAILGIYWNNHHHLLHATDHVNGAILWANLHLLFWLSLVPPATAWVDDTSFAPLPTAVYGVIQLMSGVAYFILTRTILAHHGPDSRLARAIGKDFKGTISVLLYVAAVPLAFVNRWISVGLFVAVVLMWLVPDRRIEGRVEK